MMCTVPGHRGHECLTIQATIDQLVPQWEKNIQYIEERLEQVDKLVNYLITSMTILVILGHVRILRNSNHIGSSLQAVDYFEL